MLAAAICSITGELTGRILDYLDLPKTLIRRVKDREGHDRRYALDSSKAESVRLDSGGGLRK